MPRFVTRRLGALAATLLVSSFLIYAAMYAAPGTPESFLVQGRTVSPAVLASIRAQYGLDDPFLLRYWHWLTGVLGGDLGESLTTRQDVASLLVSRIPTTLWLTTYAAVLIVVLGVGAGWSRACAAGRWTPASCSAPAWGSRSPPSSRPSCS